MGSGPRFLMHFPLTFPNFEGSAHARAPDRGRPSLMATNAILRNARRILKFIADGPSFDSVMKNVSCIIDTLDKCTVYIRYVRSVYQIT